jgi:hypothetical protein
MNHQDLDEFDAKLLIFCQASAKVASEMGADTRRLLLAYAGGIGTGLLTNALVQW